MDEFIEGAEEIFEDVTDSVTDALSDVDAGEVWDGISDGATEAWDTVADETGNLLD